MSFTKDESEEPGFDLRVEQFLASLYLLYGRIPDYYDPFSLKIWGLTQKKKKKKSFIKLVPKISTWNDCMHACLKQLDY